MNKVVLFCRVSSTNDRQNYDRQISDLTEWANSNNHHIDTVCVTEISRLGRDPLQILQTIEVLNENKISLFIQNYNIETLTADKEINPMSQFLITILAEIARMERRSIENRLSSGYQNYRERGGTVGRKAGYSYHHIGQITNTNKNNLTKLKKLFVD